MNIRYLGWILTKKESLQKLFWAQLDPFDYESEIIEWVLIFLDVVVALIWKECSYSCEISGFGEFLCLEVVEVILIF